MRVAASLVLGVAFPGSGRAADPHTNYSFDNAHVVAGSYFEISAGVPSTNAVSPEQWWRWTAPASGLISLRKDAQAAHQEWGSETMTTAWPTPTYQATNGWPANASIQIHTPFQWNSGSGGENPDGPGPINLKDLPDGSFVLYEGTSAGELAEVGERPLPLDTFFYASLLTLERAIFPVEAGRTYSLQALVQTNTQKISWLFTATPTNDQFAGRSVLAGVEVAARGNNYAATPKTNQLKARVDSIGKTVWLSWTPPESGDLNLIFSGDNMVMGVFRGESLDSLERIATLEQPEPMPAIWSLEGVAKPRNLIAVQKGVPLQFAIDSLGENEASSYELKLRLEVAPPAIDSTGSRRLEDGSFSLKVRQLRGRDVTIYRSPDLVKWIRIWRGVINGDEASFRHVDGYDFGQGFYSVRLTPSEELQFPAEGPPTTAPNQPQ